MVNLQEKEEQQKNLTHVVTSGIVGAALVPLLNRAIKPMVQRVIIPSMGPIAGNIVNAAVFIIIPPVAGMIGEVVAKKGPAAFNNVSKFAKGVSSKMRQNAESRNNVKLSKIATELRLEDKSRVVQNFESNIVPNSKIDLVNKSIKKGTEVENPSPDLQLDAILHNLKNDGTSTKK